MTNDQIKSGGELEACPFCGSPALVGQTLDDAWYVMCQEDKCLRIDNYWPTKDEAVAAWNTRTPAKAGEDGVTQADREAARAWMKQAISDGLIRRGNHNDIPLAQAFAAHRRTALSSIEEPRG